MKDEMQAMTNFRLWDVEKTESIPVEDAREADATLYIATVSATLLQPGPDAASFDRAQRILSAEFALLELPDGTTTLVERISEPTPSSEGDDTRLSLEYLTVG